MMYIVYQNLLPATAIFYSLWNFQVYSLKNLIKVQNSKKISFVPVSIQSPVSHISDPGV